MAAVNDMLATRHDGVVSVPAPRRPSVAPARAPVTADERLILILSRDADVEARERRARTSARLVSSLTLAALTILSFDFVTVLHAVGS